MSNQLPQSYYSPSTVQTLNNTYSNLPAGDYKCMVCLFLYGAADSHNMVVPRGADNPNTARYEVARAYGVRLDQSETSNTVLSGTSPEWALHPQLPTFLREWNDGKLAVVRDVGVLNKPTTKTEYNSDVSFRPDQLFAHNIQQLTWQAALPFRQARSTGWFGRTSNLIDDVFNAESRIQSSSLSVSGAILQNFPYPPKFGNVYPGVVISGGNNRGFSGTEWQTVRDLFSHRPLSSSSSPFKYPPSQTNLIHNAFRDVFSTSVDSQIILNTNGPGWDPNDFDIGTQIEEIFAQASSDLSSTTVAVPDPLGGDDIIRTLPSANFLNNVKNIAKIIYSRGGGPEAIGLLQNRQMIFAGLGGWDNHNSLRTFHDPLVRTLDICVKALIDSLKVMGSYDDVVIFTETDFGRTFRSNGTYGTDHAWSGHCFVMGGSVNGGMYGPEPDYTLSGPKDVSTLGRFIPNYSLEQYYGTLLKWFDVPESLIPLILPSINLFTPTDIGFML